MGAADCVDVDGVWASGSNEGVGCASAAAVATGGDCSSGCCEAASACVIIGFSCGPLSSGRITAGSLSVVSFSGHDGYSIRLLDILAGLGRGGIPSIGAGWLYVLKPESQNLIPVAS